MGFVGHSSIIKTRESLVAEFLSLWNLVYSNYGLMSSVFMGTSLFSSQTLDIINEELYTD